MDPQSDEENRQPQKPTATDDADARFPIGQVTTLGTKQLSTWYEDAFADTEQIAICKFSEPIAFNSVIAYTFPMSKWLHDGDPTNGEHSHRRCEWWNVTDYPAASFYAGLLVSAYAFGEVLTSMLWGSLSDRIGRKPIVLLGLGGVAVSCVMFGLAKSYWIALLARLLGGMLNGNVSVMQTMLAEMVKRPEHERKWHMVEMAEGY